MTETEITQKSEAVSPLAADRPINLKVVGADLLLAGRFDHWRPVGVSNWDDGRASAHLLFDATATSGRAATRVNPDLLSFVAKTVEPVDSNTYKAKGMLRADGSQRAADAIIQTPTGHSPFFFLTLGLERQAFSGLWTELQVLASQTATDGEAEMRPRAWLRLPVLAAA
ncbi:MAG TPA: hypothetical protein VH374_23740 [Polyangia bacterium]|nr:hypothetical protein [Polyangia bacterium]